MSREIKFRIWDDAPIKDGFKGIMINYEYAIKSSYLIDAFSGKYPIMQYTGLKDKNGVEIYEGDIIKYKYSTPIEVKFIDEVSCGCCNYASGYEWSIDEASRVEVIGNIHENPELLNQPTNYDY